MAFYILLVITDVPSTIFVVEFWNYLIFRYCRRNPMKAKLFQFHDNYRPPYYGTWRKRSECIKGRRPFAKDTNVYYFANGLNVGCLQFLCISISFLSQILDYEVDSDEEWEEDDGDADDCDKDDFDEEEKEVCFGQIFCILSQQLL